MPNQQMGKALSFSINNSSPQLLFLFPLFCARRERSKNPILIINEL